MHSLCFWNGREDSHLQRKQDGFHGKAPQAAGRKISRATCSTYFSVVGGQLIHTVWCPGEICLPRWAGWMQDGARLSHVKWDYSREDFSVNTWMERLQGGNASQWNCGCLLGGLNCKLEPEWVKSFKNLRRRQKMTGRCPKGFGFLISLY